MSFNSLPLQPIHIQNLNRRILMKLGSVLVWAFRFVAFSMLNVVYSTDQKGAERKCFNTKHMVFMINHRLYGLNFIFNIVLKRRFSHGWYFLFDINKVRMFVKYLRSQIPEFMAKYVNTNEMTVYFWLCIVDQSTTTTDFKRCRA